MSKHSSIQLFEQLSKGLPRFDDGRVNYQGVRRAPVISALVMHDGELLIVKRSQLVGSNMGLWDGISGYIDEPKSAEEFALIEVAEELGIDLDLIECTTVCDPHEVRSLDGRHDWIVYPVRVDLKSKPEITLDWEHTEHRWISPKDLGTFQHVPDLDRSLDAALGQ